MKYFCTETERKASKSTCYFEFQKGHHKGKHWLEDLEDWIVKCFEEEAVFTICGI